MARLLLPLTTLHQHLCSSPNNAITLIFAFLAIFSLVSILVLLCASHDNAKPFKTHKSRPSKLSSNGHEKRLFPGFSGNMGVSGKALLKMVSWQRVQDEEEEVVENANDEDVVWRKAIIMGGRCRPLEFSGKIEYDYEGNSLPSDDAKCADKIKDKHKGVALEQHNIDFPKLILAPHVIQNRTTLICSGVASANKTKSSANNKCDKLGPCPDNATRCHAPNMVSYFVSS